LGQNKEKVGVSGGLGVAGGKQRGVEKGKNGGGNFKREGKRVHAKVAGVFKTRICVGGEKERTKPLGILGGKGGVKKKKEVL